MTIKASHPTANVDPAQPPPYNMGAKPTAPDASTEKTGPGWDKRWGRDAS